MEPQSPTIPIPPPQVTPPTVSPVFPKKSNFAVILLSIFLLITLLIGGYLFLQVQSLTKQLAQSQVQVQITPIPSPAEASAQEGTADWKTYSNEKYSFEIKHHPESNPNEFIGNVEAGQFTYLFLIKFGTNPIKSPYGYELKVDNQKSLDDYRTELVGHITDRIDSEEETVINNNTWKKINYKIFVTTDYAPITMAIINRAGYSFAISSSALDIDQILSTFRFLDNGN